MPLISRDDAVCGPGWLDALPPYALPDWELVRAPHGAGHWLCSHTAPIGPIALAAPGVPLHPGGEALERWRCGVWFARDHAPIDDGRPDAVAELRLVEVLRLTGVHWAPWLRRVTVTVVDRTYSFAFVGTSAAPREQRAQQTQLVYDLLVEEAREAFPDLVFGREERVHLVSLRMPRTVRAFQRRAERRSALVRLWQWLLQAIRLRDGERLEDERSPESDRLLA